MKKNLCVLTLICCCLLISGVIMANRIAQPAELAAAAEVTMVDETSAAETKATLKDKNLTSSARVQYAYFLQHALARSENAVLSSFLSAAEGDGIYQADNLTDDLLLVLYNLITWSKGDSESVFSEAILEKAGTADGDWFALAVTRFGYANEGQSIYLEKLQEQVTAMWADENAAPAASDLARIALTALALGGDPLACGVQPDGNDVNLVAACLQAAPQKEGATGLAYALLLLNANDEMGYEAEKDDLLTQLLSCELADGGFALAGRKADIDTTALVLTALAPYWEKENTDNTDVAVATDNANVADVIERSLALLSEAQQTDGGFSNATTANSISCAAVLMALSSLQIDPLADERFQKDGHSLLDGLYIYYVVNDGAFELWNGAGVSYEASDRCFCALVAYYRLTRGYDTFFDLRNETPEPPAIGKPQDDSALEALDAAIAKDALPLDVTLADKELVEALMAQYEALSDADKAKLEHSEDLVLSQKILTGLARNVVIKEVFELLAATDHEYVVRGTIDQKYSYSITFRGDAISDPMDFDATILTTPKNKERIDLRANNPIYLYFCHKDKFPGKAEVEINLGGKGTYMLYHYDAAKDDFSLLKSVKLGSPFSFEANTGGDYFLSQKRVSKLSSSYSAADFDGGIVPKSVFANIQGENVNLELESKSDDGLTYKITFNGMDITEPMDFNCQISLTAEDTAIEEIDQLAEDALIIHFEHEGAMPGRALIELSGLELPDDTTLLFYYNDTEKCAEFIQKVALESGATRFIIEHCCDYFIAKRAKAGSLLTTAENGEGGHETAENASTFLDAIPFGYAGLAIAFGALVVAIIIVLLMVKKRRKKNKQEQPVENKGQSS